MFKQVSHSRVTLTPFPTTTIMVQMAKFIAAVSTLCNPQWIMQTAGVPEVMKTSISLPHLFDPRPPTLFHMVIWIRFDLLQPPATPPTKLHSSSISASLPSGQARQLHHVPSSKEFTTLPGTEPGRNSRTTASAIALVLAADELRKAGKRTDIPTRLRLIASEDSDGDGVDNLSELLLGHAPGDATDRPTAAELKRLPAIKAAFSQFLARYRWQPFEPVQRPALPRITAASPLPVPGKGPRGLGQINYHR